MSNNRYVILNCPMYFYGNCYGHTGNCDCSDCTDCVMKQIVEKCKKEITAYRNTLLPNDGTNTLHFGRQSLAYDILKLLDIQEVEQMSNLGRFGDILGIILLPFIAIFMIAISPVLLILIIWKYKSADS